VESWPVETHEDSTRLFQGSPHFRPRRCIFELEGEAAELELCQALSRLRGRRSPVLLDSAGGSPSDFSLLAFDPIRTPGPGTLEELRAFLGSFGVGADSDPLPPGCQAFGGGFVGALSYDLGVEGEALDLPRDPWALPVIAGGLYCDYLLRDEIRGRTWLVLGEAPGDGRPTVEVRFSELTSALAQSFGVTRVQPLGDLRRRVSADQHQSRIEEIRRRIELGELYQANLAHPFERDMEGDPVDIYLALRAASPTPYGGFLRQDSDRGRASFALLSCSPELLLEVRPAAAPSATRARTRPIKGTAKRAADAGEDELAGRALLASAKDRAELAMIVDLERNDLGAVARPGGVHVGEFPQLESHPAVHHLVADVRASLRPGVSAVDALAALFPGGSITGAPKLRSMEIIAELEEEGRGFAFGSLGCIDAAGAATMNLLIRTLIWRPLPEEHPAWDPTGSPPRGEVLLRVGGGITWGSDKVLEDEETLVKACVLLAVLEGGDSGGKASSDGGRAVASGEGCGPD
jgi:para-aminobenzoate synthetase component 1